MPSESWKRLAARPVQTSGRLVGRGRGRIRAEQFMHSDSCAITERGPSAGPSEKPVSRSGGHDPIPARLLRQAAELFRRRETIRFLVASNLKAGHRDKFLGHLWSLLDPLLFVGVYFFVFGMLFGQNRRGSPTFIVYLSIGVLAWRFFDGAITQATLCIKANRGLIHEISFPKSVFPVAVCLSRFYDFLWGLLVLLPILMLAGIPLTWHMLWVIPLLGLYLLFTIGVAFVLAWVGAFFADAANIATVALRVLMYLSPTFYYATGAHGIIPEKYMRVYMLNPIACFFESYRDALLWGCMPQPATLGYLALVTGVVLIVGFAVFALGEGRFAKYI